MTYDFATVEQRWQDHWSTHGTFRTANPGDPAFDPARPKYYVLDMFPYPSGVGLHVGHPLGYIATDIIARYKRMRGFNVLHPMGFDAFGLPAEQFAVEHGVHPRVTTDQNIANMVRQLKRLGLSYDWDRSLSTTDVGYYKWTQWIFLQLYNSYYDSAAEAARPIADLLTKLEGEDYYIDINDELVLAGGSEDTAAITGVPIGVRKWHELSQAEREAFIDGQRLAYLDEVPVNWCPALGTVLANEEVTNEGRSERGNHPVFKRPLRQWMLRITAYADRLIEDLDLVDWPESVKLLQRNWVGRSVGARVEFAIAFDPASGTEPPGEETITVFTTRPDTLFGATYMVLAPEHPMVPSLTSAVQRIAVEEYCQTTAAKTDMDRQSEAASGAKTGVFTGSYAINPVNNDKIPIWIADYVMMGYGTGAIMAVPAHDERDYEFAVNFGLPIKAVVQPPLAWARERMAEIYKQVTEASHRTTGVAEKNLSKLADKNKGLKGVADGLLKSLRQYETAVQSTFASPTDQECQARIEAFVRASGHAFQAAFEGEGIATNSANDEISLDGLPTAEAKSRITQWLATRNLGSEQVQYKLRDWLFSRQRYWGEPFPILHGAEGRIRAVDESQLPVELPEMADFRPTASDDPNAPPRPPLGRAPESWRVVNVNGERFERELNTMPQWAGSCWYYLRFIDPRNSTRFVGAEAERYWMGGKDGGPRAKGPGPSSKGHETTIASAGPSSLGPGPSRPGPSPAGIDLYVGGVEHAVLHLLYARFWHKVLFDLGHVSTPEPFGKLVNQGYIQAYCYRNLRGIAVPAAEVVDQDGRPALEVQSEPGRIFSYKGEPVTQEYGKMGKGLKNAIAPDEVCDQYGCDTMRLYEMYLGPLDQSKAWNTRDIVGVHRFLQRLWRVFINPQTGTLNIGDAHPPDDLLRLLHKTIKRVTEAMESMSFNVAIAALIELNNDLVKRLGGDDSANQKSEIRDQRFLPRTIAEPLLLLLAPLAPHMAEELWSRLGHTQSLAYEPWPMYDSALLVEDVIEYPVQVNGKVRGHIQVPAAASPAEIEPMALADEKVRAAMAGKPAKKVIVIKGRLVNVVV